MRTGERYLRETPLHEHAKALKAHPGVTWYADPAGATETAELRAAGLKVMKADNDIRLGIAAVTARIRTGRLRVDRASCPNLIAESQLYRYPSATERERLGENPVDDNNHALAALRYLVSRVDSRYMAKLRRLWKGDGEPIEEVPPVEAPKKPAAPARTGIWGDAWHDEALWGGGRDKRRDWTSPRMVESGKRV